MPKPNMRTRRIADLIQHEIASLLKKEIRDPRLNNLVITDVEVSADLGYARIFYTLLDKNELAAVEKSLIKATGFLRHRLAKNAQLKYTPQIEFIYDQSVIAAEELSQLIDKTISEKKK